MHNLNAAHIAIFDLDHTLLPIDSDYEWGQFLCRIGAVDVNAFEKRNQDFYLQYQQGCLDAREYLEFALGTLAQFSPPQLTTLRDQFMTEVIAPALRPAARQLLAQHQNDLVLIITATNRFVTEPIAAAFGVSNLIAAIPDTDPNGKITGKLVGNPTSGEGKVMHLQAWLAMHNKTLESYTKSFFYSDSHNDLPLLKCVSNPIATNPNNQLCAYAKAQGWPILSIF